MWPEPLDEEPAACTVVTPDAPWNPDGSGVPDCSCPTALGDALGWVDGLERMTTLVASTVFDPVEVPYTATWLPTAKVEKLGALTPYSE